MTIATNTKRQADKARAEKRREEQRTRAERVRTAGRDIGDIAAIFDVARRESCRFDLKRFCEEYNPRAFYLGWSSIHLDAIKRLEESVLQGAMYAFAMPRGSGKTTISRMAALWAIHNLSNGSALGNLLRPLQIYLYDRSYGAQS
jgi:hypothetical protein